MPTYILLVNFTQQGIQNVKQSPSRVETVRNMARNMGAEMKANYLVLGRYDYMSIFEAPNDETMAKIALATAAQGNARTETLKAFSEQEYQRIFEELP